MQGTRSFVCAAALAALSAMVVSAPVWAVPASTAKLVLDGLVGKHQVIGFTVHDGSRYLGRVLSGDHGLYIVQTFHYASAAVTTPETTTQTSYIYGRRGRVRPVTRRVTQQITSQKTIADDAAVKALVSGVAGASFRPQEQSGGREIIAPTDLRCLQQLLPPATGKANWTLQTLWAAPKLPISTAAASSAASR